MPTIVTAGERFTDIDALACAIAYTELLQREGESAEAVLPGPLNCSITPTVISWGLSYSHSPHFVDYTSVLVDISEPSHFALCVDQNNISEIYDHRYGFEQLWRDRLGKNLHLELVGSCATLIWEEFKKRGYATSISQTSARLLVYAIISNTLYFKAQISHARDKEAFDELLQYANLPSDWEDEYFKEQEKEIYADVSKAIHDDTKEFTKIPGLDLVLVMGQMELWNGSTFISRYESEIITTLERFGESAWFMSVPSIKEGKNYFYTKSDKVQEILTKTIGAQFEPGSPYGTTDILWLRKEIRAKLLQGNSS